MAEFRRFSVAEYHRLIELGILTEDDNVELLEGLIVVKPPRTPLHDGTLQKTLKCWFRLLSPGWDVRVQSGITLADSEPEPDLAIVRGDERAYLDHHPTPSEIGLVIEVADTTLARDRGDKGRIYARAAINEYWIVNLPDRQVEVYTSPSGPVPAPAFAQRTDYHPGDSIPLVLGGTTVAQFAVLDLLP